MSGKLAIRFFASLVGVVAIGSLISLHKNTVPVATSSNTKNSSDADKPSFDITKPVFTTEYAYGCIDKDNLKDITMSSMDDMNRGLRFETCESWRDIPVKVIERTSNGVYARVQSANSSPDAWDDVWVFTDDLTNRNPG